MDCTMMKTTTPVSPEAFVRAWQEEQPFRELLRADPEVTTVLDARRIDACFDLKQSLARVRSTEQAAIQRAFRYRRRGIQLKYFKLGPRLDTKALKKLAVEIAP